MSNIEKTIRAVADRAEKIWKGYEQNEYNMLRSYRHGYMSALSILCIDFDLEELEKELNERANSIISESPSKLVPGEIDPRD